MPLYFMKRYHRVLPSDGEVWYLGREVAFEAPDEAQAKAQAKKQEAGEVAPYGRLVVLYDLAGRCLMQDRFDLPWQSDPVSLGSGRR